MSLLSGIAGCTHLNTYYDYISSEVSEDGVVVGGKLQGTFSSDKKITLLSNPYELFVWVQSTKNIAVERIELIQVDSRTVVSTDSLPQPASTEKKGNGEVVKYFSRKGLTLEHKDMELIVQYRIDGAENSARVRLKTNFKKFRSNRIWDIVSGV
jgi:hypothetical protein